ncbi:pilus assembly protein PilZ [Shewanella sp. OPT22]|nr:pilus assembly protein PilZ [Shewanella sp. OPT22]
MERVSIEFDNLHQLYRAYMPFISPAGLFINMTKPLMLGETLFVHYQLPQDNNDYQFTGTVVWSNPQGASGGRPVGVGVKIESDDQIHRQRIEKLLASELNSGDLTCTM